MLRKLFLVLVISSVLSGCSPNRDKADSFESKLKCGMPTSDVLSLAKSYEASSIDDSEEDYVYVSFKYENFAIGMGESKSIATADRIIYDYIPQFDANGSSIGAFSNVLDCEKG